MIHPTTSAPSNELSQDLWLSFDLDGLREFRGQTNDVLDTGIVEHTSETLGLMREAYGVDDIEGQAEVDSLEIKLQIGAPNRPRLHAEILAATVAVVRLRRASSVLDIGCGEGLLVRALAQEEHIAKVTGVEVSDRYLGAARALLGTTTPHTGKTVNLKLIDIASQDSEAPQQHGAVTMVEVVEHVSDRDWIRHAFRLNPGLLVLTTPNRDFNAICTPENLQPNGLRHPGHVFEFTRDEFSDWAYRQGEDHGYTVNLLPIGPADMEHGSPAQMAVFQKPGHTN